jgi:hypothetical protein
MRDVVPDGGNGSLKPCKVSMGAKTENGATIPAAVSSKPQGPTEPVKPHSNKPVTPQTPSTLGAPLRLLPRKIAAQLEDGLDAGLNEQYQ